MKKTVRSMVAASLAGIMAVSLAGCGRQFTRFDKEL